MSGQYFIFKYFIWLLCVECCLYLFSYWTGRQHAFLPFALSLSLPYPFTTCLIIITSISIYHLHYHYLFHIHLPLALSLSFPYPFTTCFIIIISITFVLLVTFTIHINQLFCLCTTWFTFTSYHACVPFASSLPFGICQLFYLYHTHLPSALSVLYAFNICFIFIVYHIYLQSALTLSCNIYIYIYLPFASSKSTCCKAAFKSVDKPSCVRLLEMLNGNVTGLQLTETESACGCLQYHNLNRYENKKLWISLKKYIFKTCLCKF